MALTMDVDDLLDLIQKRRGISRKAARDALARMPGGQELLLGSVPPDESLLAAELAADDPELVAVTTHSATHGDGNCHTAQIGCPP